MKLRLKQKMKKKLSSVGIRAQVFNFNFFLIFLIVFLTLGMAGRVATRMQAKALCITHFSVRYRV